MLDFIGSIFQFLKQQHLKVFKIIVVVTYFIAVTFSSCKEAPVNDNYQEDLSNPDYFHNSINKLTDVIVHDIFSPPVASRVYAYPCIGAYEVMSQTGKLQSLSGRLNGLSPVPAADTIGGISYELAAIECFLLLSQQLIFSEEKIADFKSEMYAGFDSLYVPQKAWDNSLRYGKVVAEHISAWADKDNYKESRSFSKFSLSDNENEWKPTPPAYMESIEPHWNEIRTMVLDSAEQFVPLPPSEYSLDRSSKFYKELMEVYDVVQNADAEKKAIASFWDCNPYVMNQTGHVMYATKKITPGGHWMGITAIASEQAGSTFAEAVMHSTFVSIVLYDAFISCWDEKYRSKLVRPETVINEHIDRDWIPLLQTPPFPEHTSGHSVISTASAIMLTSLLGEDFSFTDDVEVKYGLPQRRFHSFRAAAEEAAISRLYGGIHYMPAITEGVAQGEKVGELLVERLVRE